MSVVLFVLLCTAKACYNYCGLVPHSCPLHNPVLMLCGPSMGGVCMVLNYSRERQSLKCCVDFRFKEEGGAKGKVKCWSGGNHLCK